MSYPATIVIHRQSARAVAQALDRDAAALRRQARSRSMQGPVFREIRAGLRKRAENLETQAGDILVQLKEA